MNWDLVVIQPFDGYVRGQEITDPVTVADILAGEHEGDVVKRIAAPPATPVDPDFAQKVGGILAPKAEG